MTRFPWRDRFLLMPGSLPPPTVREWCRLMEKGWGVAAPFTFSYYEWILITINSYLYILYHSFYEGNFLFKIYRFLRVQLSRT